MRNILSISLSKIGSLFKYLSNKVYVSPFKHQKGLFREKIGSSTDQLSFLNEDSLVFDVGGYEGQWASDIYGMYNCNIHIFEPVPLFVKNIQKRFNQNKKIKVNNFGLSSKNADTLIYMNKDGSSTIKKDGVQTSIKLIDISDYVSQYSITKIDLLKINIEGGEYELLQRLIESGYIKNIGAILVQFHNFFPQARARMTDLRTQLSTTHSPVYQFEFIWELWVLKKV